MALNEFKIAIGGITSIPVIGGLIFIGYKSFGESSLDTSKPKPKKKQVVNKERPAAGKKKPAVKSQNLEMNSNPPTTPKEDNSPREQPKPDK